MNLDAEIIMKLHVQCQKSMDVRDDGSGFLSVIPIVGGTFEGKLNGEIVSGGADWNTRKNTEVAHIFAKYLLKTSDGEYIAIENEGKIERYQQTFIKTSPKFQADGKGKYAWLNNGIYVGTLEGGEKEGQVEITIFRMN